jgi:hypothetical protein
MWTLIFLLFLIGFFLIFNIAEAIYDLNHWIANTERREHEGYDYINDRYIEKGVKKLTPKYRVEPKLEQKFVNILTPNLENFPKSAEDAKAKIDRLLKKSA